MNQVKPIWVYFRNRLVPIDILFLFRLLLFGFFATINTDVRIKYLALLHAWET